MGTAATSLAAFCAVVLVASAARAECSETASAGGRFPTCFDVGNQLFATASSDGFGGGVRLRHAVRFEDEPDLVWKLEHQVVNLKVGGLRSRFDGTLYQGRYLRHARDGHIVLPLGNPKKIFLPFDIGAEVEVGRLHGELGESSFTLGVVRAAALIDLSRTSSLKRRLLFGAAARWDMQVDRIDPSIDDHVVAPFSLALLSGYLESSSGLTVAEASAEAGGVWTRRRGWGADLRAHIAVERTLIAINERPLSLFVKAGYQHHSDELVGELGVRVALVQRRDRRTFVLRP